MAETRLISTTTAINISGTDISILTSYLEDDVLPDTLSSRIAGVDGEAPTGTQEGVNFKEGELLIEMKDFLVDINYYLNSDGTITVFSGEGDVDSYFIEDGFLKYGESLPLTIGSLDDFGFESAYPWGTGEINLDRTTKVSSPTNTGTGAARFFITDYEPFLNENGDKLDGNASYINYFALDVTNLIQANKVNVFSLFCKTNGIASGNGDNITFFLRKKEPNEEVFSFVATTFTTSLAFVDNLDPSFTTDWKQTVGKVTVNGVSPTTQYVLFVATFKPSQTPIELFDNLEIFFDDFAINFEDI